MCLATVTTADFVPGTLVMFHSFLKQNPWFQGDLVVIHDRLEPAIQQDFISCFDRVHFRTIHPSLKAQLQVLLSCRPDLTSRQARFYSLAIFQLTGYDKVLFCDSDLLFRESIQELFETEAALVCCGDAPHYRGHGRHATTFSEMTAPCRGVSISETAEVLRETFNAGFLLFDAHLLNPTHYRGLLSLLIDTTWQSIKTGHTDQVLYNQYFAGQQTLVSGKYNYMLPFRSDIYAKEGVGLSAARVLHFNGSAKPWQPQHLISAVQQDGGLIQALRYWYDAYLACLQDLHLKNRFLEMESNLLQGT